MSGATETETETLTPEQIHTLEAFNSGSSGGSGSGGTRQPLPGLEFLGMGYDVFGRYASVDSCKQPVLDLSAAPEVEQQVVDASIPLEQMQQAFNAIPLEVKLIYKRPKTVTYLPRFEIRSEKEFESTIDDQFTKWSTQSNVSGSYGLFSGEVDARFSSTMAKLSTTKYFSLVSNSTYYQLKLDYSLGNPAPLRAEVQEDLDNPKVAPAHFFEKYGTHYLGAVSIGCRVTISCSIETSKVDQDFDFRTFLSASYGGEKANISASNDTTYQNQVKRFREHSLMKVTGVGISDQQLGPIKEGMEASVAVLKGGWHNPSLVDFPRDALQPIWERCSTKERRDALSAEFARMAKQKGSILADLALYTPVYLYQVNAGVITYRIHPSGMLNPGTPEAGGLTWTIQNGGKPLCYILSRQIEGAVPLYQYRWGGDNRYWRYETADWQAWMEILRRDGRQWERVSAIPIGYVLNPDAAGYKQKPSTLTPVFAYCQPNTGGGPHFYWSVDAEDRMREPAEVWQRFNAMADDFPSNQHLNFAALEVGARELVHRLAGWEHNKAPRWYAWSQT